MKSAAKKAKHCAKISTRSNSIAVNALVRDLDLASVSDLTFGQVDVAQIDDLFTKLEFGPRTKSRVLKTFNTGAKASNTSGAGESTNNEQNGLATSI